jgi:hypothetical protein
MLGLTFMACTNGTENVAIGDSRATSDAPASEAQPSGGASEPSSDPGAGAVPPPGTTPAPTGCTGCAVTHDIGISGLGDIAMTCGDAQEASNACQSTPLSFAFTDKTGTTPAALTVNFATGDFCATPGNLTQTVELNGHAIGTFEGDPSDCGCKDRSRERSIIVSGKDLAAAFKKNGSNVIAIVGPNECVAIRPVSDWNGAYARVVATY